MIFLIFAGLGLSALYSVLALGCLRRWLGEPAFGGGGLNPEPMTVLRPLKSGVPELVEKLAMLVAATRPGDQVIIGVDGGTAEEMAALALRAEFPEREIVVVPCAPGAALNPKISRLVQMAPHARYSLCLLSDSESLLTAGFVEELRGEWAQSRCDVLTTAYRFTNLRGAPQVCDSLATLVPLWSGLALVRQFGRIVFTLGACTLLRREHLAAAGGWEALGAELAEDHQLGVALVRLGKTIRLSRAVLTLEGDPYTWRGFWRHQRRVAVTYRVAKPLGFAGLLLTHGVSWALLGLVCGETRGPALVVLILHLWRAAVLGKQLGLSVRTTLCWFPLASVVETVCWFLAWPRGHIWWARKWWRVTASGKLGLPPQAEPEPSCEVPAKEFMKS